RVNALLTRLSLFSSSPIMQAQFGAPAWAVPWNEVVAQRLKVFIDVSQEHNDEKRKFKMLFVFLSVIDFIKRAGATQAGDRSTPIALIVDEIAEILGKGKSPLSQDLDALVNVYMRNYNVHFVTSFQEPYQIEDETILSSLMSLGTKFYGRMTDPS